MKAVRAEITEYSLELLKEIEDLERQLLGFQKYQSSNNSSATENDPDVFPLYLEDNGED